MRQYYFVVGVRKVCASKCVLGGVSKCVLVGGSRCALAGVSMYVLAGVSRCVLAGVCWQLNNVYQIYKSLSHVTIKF